MSTRARRRTVALRRDQILAAAVTVLTRVGLAELRVADVAAELGVSTALVFYHFGSKDILVTAAFDYAFALDLDGLDEAIRDPDPLTQLTRAVRLFDGPDVPLGWQLWIDACAVAQRQPAVRDAMQRIDRRYATTLRSIIEDGVAAGAFVCPDPGASVGRILALNDGLSAAVMVLGSVTPAQLREWIVTQIALETGVSVDLLRDRRPAAD